MAPSNEDAIKIAGARLQALLDLCLLTDAVTQVVKLCSANLTLADGGNGDDGRRMYGKYLLTADTVGDTANGYCLIDAAMLLGNDGTLESLGTLTVAFLNENEDTHCITDVHLRKLGLHILLAENFDQIHNLILPCI